MQARQRVQLTGTNRSIGWIRSGRRQTPAARTIPSALAQCIGTARHAGHRPATAARSRPGNTAGNRTRQAARPKSAAGRFPGLVATARRKHPIPSRTRPLSPAAPMVLRLKTWESRSPPDHILDGNTRRQYSAGEPVHAARPSNAAASPDMQSRWTVATDTETSPVFSLDTIRLDTIRRRQPGSRAALPIRPPHRHTRPRPRPAHDGNRNSAE